LKNHSQTGLPDIRQLFNKLRIDKGFPHVAEDDVPADRVMGLYFGEFIDQAVEKVILHPTHRYLVFNLGIRTNTAAGITVGMDVDNQILGERGALCSPIGKYFGHYSFLPWNDGFFNFVLA
jgi:hypothetical protein